MTAPKPQPVATFPRTRMGEADAWAFVRDYERDHGSLVSQDGLASITWESDRIEVYVAR